jgi:hypothetical protein
MQTGLRTVTASIAALLLAACVSAWGGSAQRLIASKAFDTLPPELRAFYDANRDRITSEIEETQNGISNDPKQQRFHIIYLNRYQPFPFDSLPRVYKKAVGKFGLSKIDANGVLPWQIGLISKSLTDAFKQRNWDDVRLYSAQLAYYVAEAHDPFNTTDNTEGQRTDQLGVNDRFGKNLVDRYGAFFPMRANDAFFINDPTDNAFEDCLSAHSWLQIVLLADRRARVGLPDYTDEYYDRFYNQVGAVLVRQLSDAATAVGSYWMTSWVNAGKPTLPQH